MIFFVQYTTDMRSFQLLGSSEFETGEDAIIAASENHGEEGRYIAIPGDGLIVKQVTFRKEPILSDLAPDNPPASPTA